MLVDTSVLVELLRRPATDPLVQNVMQIVGQSPMFVSPIHLGELADASRKARLDPTAVVAKALQLVHVIPLDPAIAVEASAIKAEARRTKAGREFSLIDGIGLATARSRSMKLLTVDREFDVFADAIILGN